MVPGGRVKTKRPQNAMVLGALGVAEQFWSRLVGGGSPVDVLDIDIASAMIALIFAMLFPLNGPVAGSQGVKNRGAPGGVGAFGGAGAGVVGETTGWA